MFRRLAHVVLVAGTIPLLSLPTGQAADGFARVPGEAGGSYLVPLNSLKELRRQRVFRTTLQQKYDFSCGSAAVATLLTHQYDRPTKEDQVFAAMFERGNQAKIQRVGFSMLDMKRYLDSIGYQADGFEAKLDMIAEANVPAIVLINENGYNHFVVVKGVREDKVLIGDSATGTRIMARADLERIWENKILFVVRNHREQARFNLAADWQVRLPSPMGDSINRDSLVGVGVMVRGRNEF